MKNKYLISVLAILMNVNLVAQNLEIKTTEEEFINLIARNFNSELSKKELSDKSFKKLFYYSYKIIFKDSVIWESHNYKNDLIDSIANLSFTKSIEIFRKKDNFKQLINPEKTYMPIFIFNKISNKNNILDSVSLVPMEILFGLGKNENFESEPIFRISRPFFFFLPREIVYYKKE